MRPTDDKGPVLEKKPPVKPVRDFFDREYVHISDAPRTAIRRVYNRCRPNSMPRKFTVHNDIRRTVTTDIHIAVLNVIQNVALLL